mmetsp:Transcript_118986/g.331968  ORF Transcript_118986/g.331968 Transcript_118986/m.331968 type:complete len:275 (+) Transcript_118986:91-915(+)
MAKVTLGAPAPLVGIRAVMAILAMSRYTLLHGLHHLETAQQALVNFHHCTGIVELPTVVGCAEERDQLAAGKKLVPVFHYLVRTADQVQRVPFQEVGHHVRTEDDGDAALVVVPAVDVPLWIRPQQVAEHPGLWDFRGPRDASDLVHVGERRRQATMHADDLIIYETAHRHASEDIAKHLPHLHAVAPLAFIVEAVDPVDRGTLMITAKQKEVLRKLHLQGQEQCDSFDTLLATVHVIAKEEVIALRWHATVLENPKQVMVLSMQIATDLYGRI